MSTLVSRVSAPLINSITSVAQTSTKDVWNNYRDTSGVGVDDYRSILNEVDRGSFKGKRDYRSDI